VTPRDQWIALGVFATLELLVLDAYNRMIGLELGDLAVDGISAVLVEQPRHRLIATSAHYR
jgi:hypothetical protein